jgi:hypothetical protein
MLLTQFRCLALLIFMAGFGVSASADSFTYVD